MATLRTLKNAAQRLEKIALEVYDNREYKAAQRSHRWQRSRAAKVFKLDQDLIDRLYKAAQKFNENIEQPLEEEE